MSTLSLHRAVTLFPIQARRDDELSPEKLVIRCRMIAIGKGCNQAQAKMVGAHAEGLIGRGTKGSAVVAEARKFALHLLETK